MTHFLKEGDATLKRVNGDYDAKRHCPAHALVKSLPPGNFTEWLRSKGRLGGQHKVPRLSNDRRYLEEILSIRG